MKKRNLTIATITLLTPLILITSAWAGKRSVQTMHNILESRIGSEITTGTCNFAKPIFEEILLTGFQIQDEYTRKGAAELGTEKAAPFTPQRSIYVNEITSPNYFSACDGECTYNLNISIYNKQRNETYVLTSNGPTTVLIYDGQIRPEEVDWFPWDDNLDLKPRTSFRVGFVDNINGDPDYKITNSDANDVVVIDGKKIKCSELSAMDIRKIQENYTQIMQEMLWVQENECTKQKIRLTSILNDAKTELAQAQAWEKGPITLKIEDLFPF